MTDASKRLPETTLFIVRNEETGDLDIVPVPTKQNEPAAAPGLPIRRSLPIAVLLGSSLGALVLVATVGVWRSVSGADCNQPPAWSWPAQSSPPTTLNNGLTTISYRS